MDNRDLPLGPDVQKKVLEKLFGINFVGPSIDLTDFGAFFTYHQHLLETSTQSSITNSHEKICKAVEFLKTQATHASFAQELEKKIDASELHKADEIIEGALRLAGRLYLMCNLEGPPSASSRAGISVDGDTALKWSTNNLQHLINQKFVYQENLKEHVRLEKIFNARNLRRIAGITIKWTDNLVDHLKMTDNDRAVRIFHNSSFLRLKLQESSNLAPPAPGQPVSTSSALPLDFVQETLQTLALLFPEYDSKVAKWFNAESKDLEKKGKLPLDYTARENGALKVEERQIENFHYWHDRLVILKHVFDEAEPKNIKQWWRDRRKRVQWYTFWVAAVVLVLTIFFGLVQSIEGAMQVYVAFSSPEPPPSPNWNIFIGNLTI